MQIVKADYESSRKWMYRNARPIDLARWQFHFESGSSEPVIKALCAYQNEDGGFGFALEADAWNPNSSPIQTWAAIEILREIGMAVKGHTIIQGILRYLDSEKDFVGGKWTNTVPTNNDFPHAFWWSWNEASDYNPTANLCGFILRYADKDSLLCRKAIHTARVALDTFLNTDEIVDGHLILCYCRLRESLVEAGVNTAFDMVRFRDKLMSHIKIVLDSMQLEWCCDGVAFELIRTYRDELHLVSDNSKHAQEICCYLAANQRQDGTWDIPWQWDDYQEQWAISKNWWKAYGIITNMLFLRQFGLNRL